MDKIALLQKHLAGFKELKPDNRSKPRVPKKSKKLTDEQFKKKQEQYEEKMKDWQKSDKPKAKLRQFCVTGEGTALGGSAHRMFRLYDIPNELGETYFIGGDGESYPDFQGVVDRATSFSDRVLKLPVDRDFIRFLATLDKAVDVANFHFKDGKLSVEPKVFSRERNEENLKEDSFKNANYQLSLASDTDIRFSVNVEYLLSMFKLAQQLKIREIIMHFVSPIRPVRFEGDSLTYIIAPVRS
ncbi:hypothetical protein [Enterococcus olivae]